jgi:hypothetical protein
MFSAYCKHCGTVVLLDPTCIRSAHNTSAGMVVYFRCHAGHPGVWLMSRSTSRTVGASGAGVIGKVVAPSRATRGMSAPRRRSWWSRRGKRRPNPTGPGVAPRHGDLRAS